MKKQNTNSNFFHIFVFLIFLWSPLSARAATQFELNPNERIVALGDVHGDVKALRTILIAMKIIDDQENWIATSTHLVLLGDLNDRGTESRAVLDLVMRLENLAKEKKCHVHALLGNHEMMITQGNLASVREEDLEAYGDLGGFKSAFQGNTIYATWFRSRPAMVRIGDTLFAHGGLSARMLEASMSEINHMVKEWMFYFQGLTPAPPPNTRWVTTYSGPLWNRGLKTEEFGGKQPPEGYKLSTAKLSEILQHFKARRLVVGHTVIPNLDYMMTHAKHGDRVHMIDSGMSEAYEDGKMVAIEITRQAITSYQIKRKSGNLKQLTSRDLTSEECASLLRQ